MDEIDINKKLQDQANEIVKEAIEKAGIDIDESLKVLLNGIVVLSLRQGYIWGVASIKQTSEYLLNNMKGK